MEKQSALKVFRERTEARRMELGMPKGDLAAKSKRTRQTLNRIERGILDPKLSTIEAIANALKTTPSRLVP